MKEINEHFEYYYDSYKKKQRFDFVSDLELRDILYGFFAYVSLIYSEEISKDLDDRLIEFRKHTIILYIGSIIEASLFYYINEKLKGNLNKSKKYLKSYEYKGIQPLNKLNCGKDFHVCEIIEKTVSLSDTINFHQLLNGAKDNKIIDSNIIEKADNIRKMRNSIHATVFILGKKEETFFDLKKLFLDTKEILDYLEINI